jgi:DNA phosphorothioation-associated putative methyltransferase
MIARDRTAIRRSDLSKPIRRALQDGLVSSATEVFDYGCGHGDDVRHLEESGIKAFGWDPAHRPDGPVRIADIVNLGYVINVVENPTERADSLRTAWTFARKLLIIAARLKAENDITEAAEFEDGLITRRSTFQRFYEQQELRDWIASTLGQTPVAATPGVFYVFRDSEQQEEFIASRYRRRIAEPRVRLSDQLFDEHQEALRSLMAFVSDHGRLPEDKEIEAATGLVTTFGSMRRAFQVVRRVTGSEQWDSITAERRTDLLVYLALGRFPRRPKFSSLPRGLQLDIKALFKKYTTACAAGDALLFAAGEMSQVSAACVQAPFGKLLPVALYVHATSISRLPALLRVYEGCARVLSGSVDGATIVKLRRLEPKVSYLSYPEFDNDAHPSLTASVRVDLRSLHVKYRDYGQFADPPILHRKELFVPDDYPGRAEFETLTQAEEALGLYGSPERIGTREQWNIQLRDHGVRVRGHRIVPEDSPEGRFERNDDP